MFQVNVQTPAGTREIQTAIDKAGNAGEPAEVAVQRGTYVVGTLQMRSNVTLKLEKGAVLELSTDYADYAAVETLSEAERSRAAMLYAKDCVNISVTGKGEIYGNGAAWFAAEMDSMGYRKPHDVRPRPLVFEGCSNVHLSQFTVRESPMWTVHLVSCTNVDIDGISVDNDMSMPNTDGLDIDSCANVVVENCSLTQPDDGLCIKTSKKPSTLRQRCENVSISNCVVKSLGSAFKIGTETFYDITDVSVSNSRFINATRAASIFSRDGGKITNVTVDHVTISCVLSSPCHWGKAEPIFVSVRPRDPGVRPGAVDHVTLSDISGTAEGAVNLISEPAGLIENAVLENIELTQTVNETEYSEGQGCYDVRPPCNPENPTGMGLDNAYKMNPATGLPHGVERYPGGLPCMFLKGAEPAKMSNVKFHRPSPLPEGWNTDQVLKVQ
ncbi:hypothetical protein TRICI_001092 [Trichomonascus ciferrii]|uniref:Pectate lyase superfamily protein domain-containing protein n=1 Tax=Trichomonascus ciferrii TaxID=44093 RepID=A0A642VBI6_9ASCO|nr:hypothetical protein TRICI_001092 [Trichomonascus ciferrii]